MSLLLFGRTKRYRNLIPINAACNIDGGSGVALGWTKQDSAQPAEVVYSIEDDAQKIYVASPNANNVTHAVYQSIPASPGQRFIFSAELKTTEIATGSYMVNIQCYNGGSFLSQSYTPVNVTDAFKRMEARTTCPASTTAVICILVMSIGGGTAGARTFWARNARLIKR